MPAADTRTRTARSQGKGTSLALLTHAVAVTQADTRVHDLVSALGGRHWPEVHYTDVPSATRHLAAKGASMLVVGGSDAAWVSRAVHEARAAGRFPVAALYPEPGAESRAIFAAGATVVIDADSPVHDVVARLLALREGTSSVRGMDVRWLEAGDLRLDLATRQCQVGKDRVSLSHNEFDLLEYLMTHAQEVMPSTRITNDLWNIPDSSGLNTLRLNVGRLRKKLSDDATNSHWIESVRGIGYRFGPPVAEVGQERSEDRLRHTVATLNAQHDSLFALVDTMRSCVTAAEIADAAVRWATDRNFADAATVFRFESRGDDRHSALVASTGMSSRWRQAVSRGHRVDEGFVASAAYLRGEVIQLSDMSRPTSRFPDTVSMSSAENLHACLIFPLFSRDQIWGDIGFLSRETRAFPPARARFLRAAADVVSLALNAATDEGVSRADVY